MPVFLSWLLVVHLAGLNVISGSYLGGSSNPGDDPDPPSSSYVAPPLGPVCTKRGRRCLSNAKCLYELKKCQCPAEWPVGDGQLECTKPGHVICTVNCDPKVKTWKRARASINLPCWYRVTKFLAPLDPQPYKNSLFKWCHVEVKALNHLTDRGLFFVGAVSVHVMLAGMDNQNPLLQTDSLRIHDVTAQQATQSIQSGQNPWGVYEKHPLFWYRYDVLNAMGGKLEVTTEWQPENRFAVLKIPRCHVSIKYRPYGDQHPQMLKPGVVVTIPHSDDVKFDDYYFSVCLTPHQKSLAYKGGATRWKLKNPSQVALFYVLLQKNLYSPPSTNPEFHEQCASIKAHVQHQDCKTGRYLAIRLCAPLLSRRRRFLRCLGRDLIMRTVEKCVAWACFGQEGGQQDTCQQFREHLTTKRCRPTKLMKDIGCDDDQRKHYIESIFNPSPGIHTIISY